MARQHTKIRIAVLVVPPPLIDRGIDEVEIMYVAEESKCAAIPTSSSSNRTGNDATNDKAQTHLAGLTADLSIKITHLLSSPELAPGTIDIIMVPGPDPSTIISEAIKQFLRQHAQVPTTHILSICTGIFVLGQAGLLDGKTVTGPRALISMRLVKEFPLAKWQDTNRWEIDDFDIGPSGSFSSPSPKTGIGRLWTAGGITNGQEMVAAYLKQRFSPELADLVCVMADVGEKPRAYAKSQAQEGLGFLWIILRSFFKSMAGVGSKGTTATPTPTPTTTTSSS